MTLVPLNVPLKKHVMEMVTATSITQVSIINVYVIIPTKILQKIVNDAKNIGSLKI